MTAPAKLYFEDVELGDDDFGKRDEFHRRDAHVGEADAQIGWNGHWLTVDLEVLCNELSDAFSGAGHAKSPVLKKPIGQRGCQCNERAQGDQFGGQSSQGSRAGRPPPASGVR